MLGNLLRTYDAPNLFMAATAHRFLASHSYPSLAFLSADCKMPCPPN